MMRGLLAVFVTASLGCGGSAPTPCALPSGCDAVARIDGACSCTTWETVSSESVALPFVVVNVTYPLVGAATIVNYGTTYDAMVPTSASMLGTNVRAVIRRADGSEQIARVGALPDTATVSALSPTEFGMPLVRGGVSTCTNDVDVPASRGVWIDVWTNARATVHTDQLGEKTVDWSVDLRSYWPGLFVGSPQGTTVTPALIRGEVFWDDEHAAWVAGLSAADRAALVAFDPREDGQPISFPRYLLLADVPVDATARPIDATWYPCAGTDEFDVLAETATPLQGGDTLVLQYGVQRDVDCAPQRPGILIASSEGCTLHTSVLVDRLAGTLLMTASSPSPGCTTP